MKFQNFMDSHSELVQKMEIFIFKDFENSKKYKFLFSLFFWFYILDKTLFDNQLINKRTLNNKIII